MFFEKRIIKNLKMESSHIVSVDFSLDSELKKKIIEGIVAQLSRQKSKIFIMN